MIEWGTLYITLKLALITTSLLLFIGIPIAYWLAYGSSRLKFIFEALIALPLVLPPSVLGFLFVGGIWGTKRIRKIPSFYI